MSLRETVAKVAAEVGVPGGEAYVYSDEGMRELAAQLHHPTVNGKRVSAAPTFSLRVGNALAPSFSGAQEKEQWLSMLEQCADYAEAQQ